MCMWSLFYGCGVGVLLKLLNINIPEPKPLVVPNTGYPEKDARAADTLKSETKSSNLFQGHSTGTELRMNWIMRFTSEDRDLVYLRFCREWEWKSQSENYILMMINNGTNVFDQLRHFIDGDSLILLYGTPESLYCMKQTFFDMQWIMMFSLPTCNLLAEAGVKKFSLQFWWLYAYTWFYLFSFTKLINSKIFRKFILLRSNKKSSYKFWMREVFFLKNEKVRDSLKHNCEIK